MNEERQQFAKGDFSQFNLCEKLSAFNLEDHLEEIVQHIWGDKFEDTFSLGSCKHWNETQVVNWVKSLKFLSDKAETIAIRLEEECIDGELLLQLSERNWTGKLGIDFLSWYMMELIFHGWALGSRSFKLPVDMTVPIGVAAGIVADLSNCDTATAERLVAIDEECTKCGIGYIYGQVVVLGYKEYRLHENVYIPFGLPNEKWVLKRRRVPNGVVQCKEYHTEQCGGMRSSTTSNDNNGNCEDIKKHNIRFHFVTNRQRGKEEEENLHDAAAIEEGKIVNKHNFESISLAFEKDPSKDMFQIGRAAHSTNDFVVPGQLHEDDEGIPTGPVSRYACRIECDRLPPFHSKIFAGGFNDQQQITTNKVFEEKDSTDGFTTFGVKIWQPEVKKWIEISVLGNIYEPRSDPMQCPTTKISSSYQNLLTNGTIIDIGGVTMVFQSPVSMSRFLNVHPTDIIGSLNDMKPQCPVLFNEIKFSYLNNKQRAINATDKSTEDNVPTMMPFGSVHIPSSDYSNINEENRSYVFPACGHVHGFHPSMINKPCPLCRKSGPFVPIAFAFEPSLCDKKPTHVFNPCGHVASLRTCHYWSQIPIYSRNLPVFSTHPICPFCATELVKTENNGNINSAYYNKLILQTELGDIWPAECTLEEEEQMRSALQKDTYCLREIITSQQLLFEHDLRVFYTDNINESTINDGSTTNVNNTLAATTKRMLAFPKFVPQLLK